MARRRLRRWAERLGGPLLLAVLLAQATDAGSAECEDRPQLELVTATQNRSLDAATAVIRLSGPLAPPMADELDRLRPMLAAYDRLIVDLDSPGGALAYAEELAGALRDLRRDATVNTLVRNGARCLSACVLLFMQGEKRVAGGSSAWLFHGVCRAFADLPLPRETERFIAALGAAGATAEFAETLRAYLPSPGELWLSGYELYAVHHAGIITDLLDAWQPLGPSLPD